MIKRGDMIHWESSRKEGTYAVVFSETQGTFLATPIGTSFNMHVNKNFCRRVGKRERAIVEAAIALGVGYVGKL